MRFGMTPLGAAVMVMSADSFALELEELATADILERDVYGNTAAHYAIERYVNGGNNEDVCELLINTNKDIEHIPNKNKQLPFDLLEKPLKCTDPYECNCETCFNREVTEYLDTRSVTCCLWECKAYELPGTSPLNKSILKMHGGLVDEITQAHPDEIATKDIFGNTAGHYAAYRDSKGMLDLLLDRCPDKTIMMVTNNMGQKPADIVKTGKLQVTDKLAQFTVVYDVEPGCDCCSLRLGTACERP